MRTSALIKEIESLPVPKRIYVLEKTIHSIRKHEELNQMKKAANELYADYKTDKELIIFTSLDYADFYETKLSMDVKLGPNYRFRN